MEQSRSAPGAQEADKEAGTRYRPLCHVPKDPFLSAMSHLLSAHLLEVAHQILNYILDQVSSIKASALGANPATFQIQTMAKRKT